MDAPLIKRCNDLLSKYSKPTWSFTSSMRDISMNTSTVESLTDVVFAKFDGSEIERMSPGCQLHFTRAIVRTLVERLELANLRLSQGQKN